MTIAHKSTKTPAVAGPNARAATFGPRLTSHPVKRLRTMATNVRYWMPSIPSFKIGIRSAMNVTIAAMLTRKVRVYSTKVMAAFTFTAQPPNSSSFRPLPPLPSITHCITSRYMADTTAIVRITSHTEAPNVTCATPATTTSLRKGPNTYRGEVAGSPPPARAPSNELFNL